MRSASWLLAFVTAQRLAELALARRNTRALLAQGAHEVGAGRYPLLVALHAAWLGGLWLQPRRPRLERPWLMAYLALQVLRAWTVASLGPRWTTRIIVVPDERLVRRGPYRFVRHPNYLVVAGEIAALPLALGRHGYAFAFSALNAVVLAIRVRAEEHALGRDRPQPCSKG